MTDLDVAIEPYRFCLRKLLFAWKQWEGNIDLPPDKVAVAHLVIPWAAQVHRFGRAFLQIEKVELEHEAHPLVRSALEYAVVGHWAAPLATTRWWPDTARTSAS